MNPYWQADGLTRGDVIKGSRFQLFPALTVEEYTSLRADIEARGILIPIEVDQEGTILDGFHRSQIATELDIEAPTIRRTFASDDDRFAHVIALNLKRRHLDPVSWGEFFGRYCHARGIDVDGQPGGDQTRASDTVSLAAEELGVNRRTAFRRLEAARLPAEYRDQVREGKKTLNAVKKEIASKTRGEAQPLALPTGVYQTIVADPPWVYERGDIRGSAEGHYPVMSIEEIAALAVRPLAGSEAHLYLWVTNPHLPLVWPVLAAWGFDYKTLLTWVKPQMGTGFYFRSATEHVIFATRGNLPLRDRGIRNWFEAARTEHSAKPEPFYEIVERASHGPYLELFARRPRAGWTGWGDEL